MSDSKEETTVVNVKKAELKKLGYKDFADWNSRENTHYIGRNMSYYVPGAYGSKWGNPFSTKKYTLEKSI